MLEGGHRPGIGVQVRICGKIPCCLGPLYDSTEVQLPKKSGTFDQPTTLAQLAEESCGCYEHQDEAKRTNFNGCDAVTAAFEQDAKATGCHALSQATYHATSDENVFHLTMLNVSTQR